MSGLKTDPGLDNAVQDRGLAFEAPRGRSDAVDLSVEHRCDGVASFHGLHVPCERDKVAPEALVAEQRRRPGDIASRKGGAEFGQPTFDVFLGFATCAHSHVSRAGSSSRYSWGFRVFITGVGSDDGEGMATPILANV